MPGWVGPTAALSLVVIALAFAAIATGSVLLARTAGKEIAQLSEKLEAIRGDLHDAMHAIRRVAENGEELSTKLKDEVEHYLATSRAIRHDLDRGVRKVKSRLADLDALYEVVHGEVEDTALDVAARVRAVRRGSSMVGRLRRWLVRGAR